MLRSPMLAIHDGSLTWRMKNAASRASIWRSRRRAVSAIMRRLLERLAVAADPSARVPAVRIVVRPVHDAPFRIPRELAAEGHGVARLERRHARREIDVVRDQDRVAGRQPDQEALVAA